MRRARWGTHSTNRPKLSLNGSGFDSNDKSLQWNSSLNVKSSVTAVARIGRSTQTVRDNLQFLVSVHLLPEYEKSISAYLHDNPTTAPQVTGSTSSAESALSNLEASESAARHRARTELGMMWAAAIPFVTDLLTRDRDARPAQLSPGSWRGRGACGNAPSGSMQGLRRQRESPTRCSKSCWNQRRNAGRRGHQSACVPALSQRTSAGSGH